MRTTNLLSVDQNRSKPLYNHVLTVGVPSGMSHYFNPDLSGVRVPELIPAIEEQ